MNGTRAKATALLAVLQLIMPHALARAQSRGVDTLFPAQPVGYVNDFASCSIPHRGGLEDLIRRLRAATGAEVAVVTLPSIGEQEAAEVALAIGRKWESRRQSGHRRSPAERRHRDAAGVPARTTGPAPGTSASRWGRGSKGSFPMRGRSDPEDVMGPDLAA